MSDEKNILDLLKKHKVENDNPMFPDLSKEEIRKDAEEAGRKLNSNLRLSLEEDKPKKKSFWRRLFRR